MRRLLFELIRASVSRAGRSAIAPQPKCHLLLGRLHHFLSQVLQNAQGYVQANGRYPLASGQKNKDNLSELPLKPARPEPEWVSDTGISTGKHTGNSLW